MKTPLFEKHAALGARMIDFNGWEMPLYYSGIVDEHRAVRNDAGVFDLCHMARFRISGKEAEKILSENTTNDVFSVKTGRAVYSLVCNSAGGIIDDILIYRFEDHFLVVANAGNRGTVLSALSGKGVRDITDEMGMIAVQGPKASAAAERLFGGGIFCLKNYGFAGFSFEGSNAAVSRTGYTGEDGFEVYFDAALSSAVWDALLDAGADSGIRPAGLGARDVLRLEAGMPLYGNELDASTNPFEAGLGRFVSFEKSFTGKEAIIKYRTESPERVLKGIITSEKAVPRRGCPICRGEAEVGTVTSGSYSPSLDKSIGMGYINKAFSDAGTRIEIRIRNRGVTASVVDLPFYKKEKADGSG